MVKSYRIRQEYHIFYLPYIILIEYFILWLIIILKINILQTKPDQTNMTSTEQLKKFKEKLRGFSCMDTMEIYKIMSVIYHADIKP